MRNRLVAVEETTNSLERQTGASRDGNPRSSSNIRAATNTAMSKQQREYPLGLPRGGEDKRPIQPELEDDNIRPQTMVVICWCGRQFGTTRNLRIHQSRKKCSSVSEVVSAEESPTQHIGSVQAQPSQLEENASQVYNHSAQSHQVEETESEESSRKAKIKWPSLAEKQAWKEMEEDLTRVLELSLKGEIQNELRVLGETVYSYGAEMFRMLEVGKEKEKGKGRREREIEELRQMVNQVKRQ